MAKPKRLEITYRKLSELRAWKYPRNSRTHSDEQLAYIAKLMREFGWTNPILLDADKQTIIAGHGRIDAAPLAGYGEEDEVPTINISGWTQDQVRAYIIADNRSAELAGWNTELLLLERNELAEIGFDVALLGFTETDIADLLEGIRLRETPDDNSVGSLADRFGVAPFSVLNAREGWWQERKRAWLALGIRSELGRGENLLKFSETVLEPDAGKRKARAARSAARQEPASEPAAPEHGAEP
jgi:ParB-like chromosome segregation protein Spo0J